MVVAIFGVGTAVVVVGCVAWYRRRRPQRVEESRPGVPVKQAGAYELGLRPGEDGCSVMYTLRSCRHCVRLKKFLDAHGIPCHLVYVDEFTGTARTAMMDKVRALNPRGSFPTLVLPGGRVLVGFREHQVREAYGLPTSD